MQGYKGLTSLPLLRTNLKDISALEFTIGFTCSSFIPSAHSYFFHFPINVDPGKLSNKYLHTEESLFQGLFPKDLT